MWLGVRLGRVQIRQGRQNVQDITGFGMFVRKTILVTSYNPPFPYSFNSIAQSFAATNGMK